MRRPVFIFISAALLGIGNGYAQTNIKGPHYEYLLKGGRVMDPGTGLDGRFDIAIRDGKVARIARRIDVDSAAKTIRLRGCVVVPGLIDLHTHVFAGSMPNRFADGLSSVNPDHYCPMNGITTVVDAGTSGWRNFEQFRSQIMETSKTRVLAFLNIAGNGMSGKPGEEDLADMQVQPALEIMRRNSDRIVGVKVGHFEGKGRHIWTMARQLADSAQRPLFVECHLPDISLEDQLKGMRPGDIITHTYEQVRERRPVVDSTGHLLAEVLAARDRGILFDLGHGGAGFWYDQAIPAIRKGFLPNTLGTDLHRSSIVGSMKGLALVMSKCMAMGMTLMETVDRATRGPAQAIGRPDLGRLQAGYVADITVLRIHKGRFGYPDAGGRRIFGRERLSVEMTIREGRVIWDLQGRTASDWHQ